MAVEGSEAHLVDDQEPAVEIALRLQPSGRDRGIALEDVHEIIEHEVGDGEAVLHGFDAQGDREMALADAGRAEEERNACGACPNLDFANPFASAAALNEVGAMLL